MASGALEDSDEDLNSRRRCRWTENSKVYTRRIRKKTQNTCNNPDTAATQTSTVPTTSATEVSSAPDATYHSSFSTFVNPYTCLVATPVPTINGVLEGNDGDEAVEERQVATITDGVTLDERLQHEEESLSPEDISHQHQQGEKHQEQLPSPSDGHQSIRNQLEESGGQGVELRNLDDPDDSPLAPSNEAQNLRKPSPGLSEQVLLEMDGDNKSQSLREEPSLSSEDRREVNPPHQSIGTKKQNDEQLMPGLHQVPQVNVRPLVVSRVDDSIRFYLCKSTPKDEIMDLRNKLECELDLVRGLVTQVELRQSMIASHNTQISNSMLSNNSNYIGPDGTDIGLYSHLQPQHALVKMGSEMNVTGHQETRPNGLIRVHSDMGAPRDLETRPYSRQLSVAVMENNHRASEYVEKEKRTPKANQYYRNSEFLLGKDRLPPENNKRLKTSNRRRGNGETEHAFGFVFDKSRNQAFRSCSSLLQRLMKHKYGWVFNEPVDAKALGLFDYHDIIKHPMDLGTIKTRLAQNWYKSTKEFTEDVRLVFHNAMTYNPKGQDVHVMAEQLLQIFEDKWVEIEYNYNLKYQTYMDGGFRTPTPRKAAPQSHFGSLVAPAPSISDFVPAAVHAVPPTPASMPLYTPAAPQIRTSDRPDPRIHRPHLGRTPVPKKPKAKDPDKRDMTYDEKQRLSNKLQGLPHDKLDAIVQIIKKRNTALSQHDDEIEVDIDSVDPETLWELDRFVTNYKKSLSKNKRKAEIALQARMTSQNALSKNSNPSLEHAHIDSGAAFEKSNLPVEGETQSYDRNRSSSSSGSSSDSGSSSSDSDSDSSSADGSDAGNSPGT